MNRWNHALLCVALLAGTTSLLHAQDGQAAPDGQGGGMRRGGQGGPGGGRRGGGVRGTVTGVTKDSVTVKNEQGETWTVITTDNTRVRRDGQPGTLAGVQTGDEVMAMGMPDADKHEVHAMFVMDVSAAEVAKAKANLGKTYIVGRITAINDTQLTILRQDKVSQVITLDESTSLHKGGRPAPEAMQAAGLDMGMGGMMGGGGGGGRRGGSVAASNDATAGTATGESITLADVKVGDNVVGTGAMKGTSFVPTDLHVMERGMGGRRGAGGNGGGGGDAPPQQ